MSSLAMTYDELRTAIGQFLGFGSNSAAWTAEQIAAIDVALKDGYRQFLYPPGGHDWTFLHPVATIYIYGTVTGTVASSTHLAGTTTIESDADLFYPSMVGATIQASGDAYTITGYVSATEVTVAGNAEADFVADDDVTVTSGGVFALPDDFDYLESQLTFPADSYRRSVQIVSEYEIRRRQQQSNSAGDPEVAAIRPKARAAGEAPRQELLTLPTPSEPVVLTYSYKVVAPALDSTDNQYPYGADKHGLCLKEACLAAAETSVLHLANGDHQALFVQRLAAAIEHDLEKVEANRGFSLDGEQFVESQPRHLTLSYNGTVL